LNFGRLLRRSLSTLATSKPRLLRHKTGRSFRDLELHRPLDLLLHDDRPRGHATALEDIVNALCNKVTPAQLTVDGEVE
jgi:hypothetical protein